MRSLLGDEDIPAARRVVYAVGFLTGMRAGEMSGITWGHLRDERGVLAIRVDSALANVTDAGHGARQSTKTPAGKRWIPVHPTLARWLAWWRVEGWISHVGRAPTEDDAILPGADGGEAYGRWSGPLRDDLVQVGLSDTYKGKPLETRAWRRSFASWLEAAEVPENLVKRLMGHQRPGVTSQRYTAGDMAALARAVASIDLDVPPGTRHENPSHDDVSRTCAQRNATTPNEESVGIAGKQSAFVAHEVGGANVRHREEGGHPTDDFASDVHGVGVPGERPRRPGDELDAPASPRAARRRRSPSRRFGSSPVSSRARARRCS